MQWTFARALTGLIAIAGVVAGCATALTSAQLTTFRDDYHQRLTSDSTVVPYVISVSEPRDRRAGPGTVETLITLNGSKWALTDVGERETVLRGIVRSLVAACRSLPPERTCAAVLQTEKELHIGVFNVSGGTDDFVFVPGGSRPRIIRGRVSP
jgi:hypothetical protein